MKQGQAGGIAQLAGGILLAVLLAAGSAWARSQTEDARPRHRGATPLAAQRLQAGIAALASRDFAGAYRALAESFRQEQSPEVLYHLGALALAQGRMLDAQDLMRRYLTESEATSEPGAPALPASPAQLEARRVVALPRPPSGKLHVIGQRGTILSIDDRVVAALPLSRPLLVSPSEHKVTMELAGQRQEDQVQVPPGRLAELRFNRSSNAFLMSLLPAALLLEEYAELGPDAQRALGQALEDGVQRQQLSAFPVALALELVRDPELGKCIAEPACQLKVARKCEIEYLLRARVRRSSEGGPSLLSLQLVDVDVGDVAATAEMSCSACGLPQVAAALTESVVPLIAKGQGRRRGTLSVQSTPPGAEVSIGERLLGVTPYKGAAWSGPLELVVALHGYESERRQLVVPEQGQATVEVALQASVPEPPPAPLLSLSPPPIVVPPPPPPGRPRWRVVTGAVALGAGALLLGFGGAALGIAGQCVDSPMDPSALCEKVYQTGGLGAGLTIGGGALLVGGALLLALPEPQRRREVQPTK